MARAFDVLLDIVAAIAATILFMMIMIIALDVLMRTVGGPNMTWVLEASEHGLLAILCLGLPWLAREKGHVSIEILTEFLPISLRSVLSTAMSLAVALLLAWLTGWAVKMSIEAVSSGVRTNGLYPIPRWTIFAAIAGGFGLTALEYLRQGLGFGRPIPGRELPL